MIFFPPIFFSWIRTSTELNSGLVIDTDDVRGWVSRQGKSWVGQESVKKYVKIAAPLQKLRILLLTVWQLHLEAILQEKDI